MSLLRISFVLTIVALLSRGLGLVRDIAITFVHGDTLATDSFYAATSLTYAAYIVVGASLTSVTVPYLRETADGSGRDAELRAISSILNVTALLLVALAMLGMFYSDVVAHALVGERGAEITAGFIFILMPSIILLGSAGILSGILNQSRVFFPVSAAPAMLNIFVIVAVLIPWGVNDIRTVLLGTLAGSVAFFLIQIPRLHGVNYRHTWRIRSEKRHFARFFGPAMPILAVSSLTYSYTFVDISLASRLGDGIVTSVNVATKLIQLPQGIIAMGLTAASFPMLSAYSHSNQFSHAARLAGNVSLVILMLALPVTAFLVVTADLVIRIVFGQTTFSQEGLVVTTRILGLSALSLPALALNIFLLRVFYALTTWRIPLLGFLAGFVVKLVFSHGLLGVLGIDTIALSTVLATSLTSLIMAVNLKDGLNCVFGTSFVAGVGRILIATILVTLLVVGARRVIMHLAPDLWDVGLFSVLAVLASLAMLVLLKSILRAELALFWQLRAR